MGRLLQTGRGRFDPTLKDVYTPAATAGGDVAFGGYLVPVTTNAWDPATVGLFAHRHGLYAAGHLASLPTAGANGFVSDPDTLDFFGPVADFWEPPPGFGAAGRITRAPRILLVIPSRSTVGSEALQRDECSARLQTLFDDDLAAIGVAVCMSGSAAARIDPMAAAWPTLGVTIDQVYLAAPTGRIHLPAWTRPDDDGLAGAEVMVIELNSSRVGYGGASSAIADHTTSGYAVPVFTPTTPVPGATVYNYADDSVSILAFAGRPSTAKAQALADRSLAYKHVIFQADRMSRGGATVLAGDVDDEGVYATLFPSPPDFLDRIILPEGDADGSWAIIRTAVLDFFSPA